MVFEFSEYEYGRGERERWGRVHYYKILFCEALKNELGGGQKKNRLG